MVSMGTPPIGLVLDCRTLFGGRRATSRSEPGCRPQERQFYLNELAPEGARRVWNTASFTPVPVVSIVPLQPGYQNLTMGLVPLESQKNREM